MERFLEDMVGFYTPEKENMEAEKGFLGSGIYISTKTMNSWVPALSFRGVYVLRNRCISVIICILPTWGSWMHRQQKGLETPWKSPSFGKERCLRLNENLGSKTLLEHVFFATWSELGCHDKRKPWAGKTQTPNPRAMVSNVFKAFYPYLGRRSNLTCAYIF